MMNGKGVEPERFLHDVSEHKMEVIRDDGVHRHLRFQKPGDSIMWFDVVTWPGVLCYTGDMGTYVFQRAHDMLGFFRGDKLTINPSYWSQKCIAKDRDGIKEFNAEKFKEAIRDHLEASGASEEVREGAEEDLVSEAEDFVNMNGGVDLAITAVMEWGRSRDCVFDDFHEYDITEHTLRFQWCCYALVWAVQQYDKRVAAVVGEV